MPSPMNVTLLAEAERLLVQHDPATFDTAVDAFPECIDAVRAVEDEQAWQASYPSLEAFYAAHEELHPDIRLYGQARRDVTAGDPLTSGGLPSQRLERLRRDN